VLHERFLPCLEDKIAMFLRDVGTRSGGCIYCDKKKYLYLKKN